jgi:hypothetical protein
MRAPFTLRVYEPIVGEEGTLLNQLQPRPRRSPRGVLLAALTSVVAMVGFAIAGCSVLMPYDPYGDGGGDAPRDGTLQGHDGAHEEAGNDAAPGDQKSGDSGAPCSSATCAGCADGGCSCHDAADCPKYHACFHGTCSSSCNNSSVSSPCNGGCCKDGGCVINPASCP